MKKSTLISISIVLLILSLTVLWYYGSETDVKIVDMHASSIQAMEPGQLDIVLQNNGIKPVDVWLDVENTFVDKNGESHSTTWLINSSDSKDPYDAEYVSLEKPIHLLPGNNTVSIWLGYEVPGKYPVKVKVVENSRVVDEDSYLVVIPLPEIHLKLEYEMESRNTSDIYRIYGYLINKGLGSALNVSTNLTITNERTGELVVSSSEFHDVGESDKSPLWSWPDYPYAVVEIAHGKPSGESYVPVENVAIGGNDDHFKVNVTARWQNQVTSAELLIPPREESRGCM